MINEQTDIDPLMADGYLEVTPGPDAHIDEPRILVAGRGPRSWELASRIERMLEHGE